MTTTNAAFNSWERRWANYYAYGGVAGDYAALSSANRLPGRVVNPSSQEAWVTLTRSDPRATVVYPNYFRLFATANALEPTSGEWQNYAIQQVNRNNAVSGSWEAVETSSGVWKVRNKSDIVFPAAGASSTGATFTHALMMIPNYGAAGFPMYPCLVAELDSQIVIPSGGTGAVTIPAQTLEFEFR